MKLWKVTYEYSYNNPKTAIVVARTAAQAIDAALFVANNRHYKNKWNITNVEFQHTIDRVAK